MDMLDSVKLMRVEEGEEARAPFATTFEVERRRRRTAVYNTDSTTRVEVFVQ